MLRQLITDNETTDRTLRETANVADEVNDIVTADLVTERMAVRRPPG
jgi:DNA-binding ferritin-like protein